MYTVSRVREIYIQVYCLKGRSQHVKFDRSLVYDDDLLNKGHLIVIPIVYYERDTLLHLDNDRKAKLLRS